jgi:hypothetical protein
MNPVATDPRTTPGLDLHDGDVIEITHPEGNVTALVLLAGEGAAILDLCDGSMPVAVDYAALRPYRVFTA